MATSVQRVATEAVADDVQYYERRNQDEGNGPQYLDPPRSGWGCSTIGFRQRFLLRVSANRGFPGHGIMNSNDPHRVNEWVAMTVPY